MSQIWSVCYLIGKVFYLAEPYQDQDVFERKVNKVRGICGMGGTWQRGRGVEARSVTKCIGRESCQA